MTTCQHKTVFWDEDEWRCRTCSQSLSFPARPPGPEDEIDLKKARRITAGEHRRLTLTPVEDQDQVVIQDQVVLPERQAIPSTQLLICHCCMAMLPQENFHHRNSTAAAKRQFRSNRCRPCTAFQLRVQRQLDPERTRQRDQERRARYQAALTPGQRDLEKQRRGAAGNKMGNALAQVRSRARQDGRGVPKQRPGRPSLHIKPVCRIYRGCPLREYCTTEAKGLA